jgi:uncharacterized protein (TIGR03435 family)
MHHYIVWRKADGILFVNRSSSAHKDVLDRPDSERGKMFRAAIPAAAILAACCAAAQTLPPMAFEAASVRLSKDMRRSPSLGPAPGGRRFTSRNMPLPWLISSAYDVSIRQLSGLPDSFNSSNYDIDATVERPASREQMMRMLQTLLEDRFKLRIRRETKDLSVYVLTAAKNGPKLDQNKDGADLEARTGAGCKREYRNFPMSLLANILSGDVEDTVVDKTGLAAGYDFTLQFMPERVGPGVKEGREPACPDGLPSIFTALREQLGLELIRQKTPVELLTIEHIENPSEN